MIYRGAGSASSRGYWHIGSKSDRGGGKKAPFPSAPLLRVYTSHGPTYGESLKEKLARGFLSQIQPSPGIATTSPAPGGVGDVGILKAERQVRGKSHKARLLPSLRVIVGVSTLTRQNL